MYVLLFLGIRHADLVTLTFDFLSLALPTCTSLFRFLTFHFVSGRVTKYCDDHVYLTTMQYVMYFRFCGKVMFSHNGATDTGFESPIT